MKRLCCLLVALLAAASCIAAPVLSVSADVIDWGDVSFFEPIPTQPLYLTNTGDAPLALTGWLLLGGNFELTGPCNEVFTLAPAASCRFDVTLTLTNAREREVTGSVEFDAVGGQAAQVVEFRAHNVGSAGLPPAVDVVEYYNHSLDHYFITWLHAEQANLDAGNTPSRWERTGYSFRAYTAPRAGTSPVCRYYIPPGLGDSHFFGRGTAECDATGQRNPRFVLESPNLMQIYLPAAGTCPAGTTPIYRTFSNRADANHRYMTDRSLRDAMVASGWLAEGDGPDLVVMCAPA